VPKKVGSLARNMVEKDGADPALFPSAVAPNESGKLLADRGRAAGGNSGHVVAGGG